MNKSKDKLIKILITLVIVACVSVSIFVLVKVLTFNSTRVINKDDKAVLEINIGTLAKDKYIQSDLVDKDGNNISYSDYEKNNHTFQYVNDLSDFVIVIDNNTKVVYVGSKDAEYVSIKVAK